MWSVHAVEYYAALRRKKILGQGVIQVIEGLPSIHKTQHHKKRKKILSHATT
jgi:hypothetical protein